MTAMFRKLAIALGAAAVVAAAALSPTTASAGGGWHGHHGHHGWHGGGFRVGFYAPAFAPAYAYGSDCYVVRRVVYTPYGKRIRRETVCN
jgi:hypothetical protein